MIVASGNRKVDKTSRPGLDKACREKTTSTSAMHEPAPATAASREASTTSFNRIRAGSLVGCWAAKSSSLVGGRKAPPRIPQGRTTNDHQKRADLAVPPGRTQGFCDQFWIFQKTDHSLRSRRQHRRNYSYNSPDQLRKRDRFIRSFE